MEISKAAGLGVAAGAAGTLALTIAETMEMKITGREPSSVPGEVGAKVLSRDPARHRALVERLNPVVHWGHGLALGAVRGLLDAAGLSRRDATLLYFPIVWGGDALLYRALDIAPVPWKWSREDLLTDLFGKGVLAFATSGAYIALNEFS